MDKQRIQAIGDKISREETFAAGSGRSYFRDGLWQLHRSVEGGTPTIGHGHKITDAEAESGTIKIDGEDVPYSGGLTETQARWLLDQRVKKGVAELPEDMPDEFMAIALDVSYRLGSMPKRFLAALKKGDLAGAYAETGDLFYTPHDEEGNALPREYYNARNSRIFANAGYTPTEEAQDEYNRKQRESIERDPNAAPPQVASGTSTGNGLQDILKSLKTQPLPTDPGLYKALEAQYPYGSPTGGKTPTFNTPAPKKAAVPKEDKPLYSWGHGWGNNPEYAKGIGPRGEVNPARTVNYDEGGVVTLAKYRGK